MSVYWLVHVVLDADEARGAGVATPDCDSIVNAGFSFAPVLAEDEGTVLVGVGGREAFFALAAAGEEEKIEGAKEPVGWVVEF